MNQNQRPLKRLGNRGLGSFDVVLGCDILAGRAIIETALNSCSVPMTTAGVKPGTEHSSQLSACLCKLQFDGHGLQRHICKCLQEALPPDSESCTDFRHCRALSMTAPHMKFLVKKFIHCRLELRFGRHAC